MSVNHRLKFLFFRDTSLSLYCTALLVFTNVVLPGGTVVRAVDSNTPTKRAQV